jgi:hypothetical protein
MFFTEVFVYALIVRRDKDYFSNSKKHQLVFVTKTLFTLRSEIDS